MTFTFLLLSFNSYATTRIKIIPNNDKLATMQLEEETLTKAVKRLKKICKKSQWLKYKLRADESGYIFTETETDQEGVETTLYAIPSNFKVKIKDITSELEDEKAAKKARKDKRKALKALKSALHDTSPVGEWRLKVIEVLDYVLDEIKED